MKRLKQFIDQNRNENVLLNSTNTIINYNNNHKEKILNEIDTSSNSFSQSQINFFSERPNFYHHPFLEEAFKSSSYEIFQFLDNKDINNLRKTNKFFWDICDCYFLFDDTIQSLSKLFSKSLNNDINDDKDKNNKNKKSIIAKDKKSKVMEKYNFNQSVDKYYKNTDEYYKRIQSARKNKNIKKKNLK